MEKIDVILKEFREKVELEGRSGSDSVYLLNSSFSIPAKEFACPLDADPDGASADFLWFLQCSKQGCVVPHPAPDKSFWIRTWGRDALPYGAKWNINELLETLRNPAAWRRAVVYNYSPPSCPPCILCYQFLPRPNNQLDCVVTMRSSDVVKVLPQDVLMTWYLCGHICHFLKREIGEITFNIANAHIYWEDLEPYEFDIDFPS